MHSTRDKEKKWKTECGVPLELTHGSNNAKGVAILLRNGFDCKIKQNFVDPAGRYIGVQAQINDEIIIYLTFTVQTMIIKLHNFMIISLPSWKKRPRLWNQRIIGRDFNCPMNPMLDKQGGIIRTRKKIVERIEEI